MKVYYSTRRSVLPAEAALEVPKTDTAEVIIEDKLEFVITKLLFPGCNGRYIRFPDDIQATRFMLTVKAIIKLIELYGDY